MSAPDKAHRVERAAEHATDHAGHPTDSLAALVSSLSELVSRFNEPAVVTSRHLGPSRLSTRVDHRGTTYSSVTIHNQGPVPIYVSTAGEMPRAGSGARRVAEGAMVTLPIRNERLEIAVDAGDQAAVTGTFQVDIYRYLTVQPAAYYAPNVGVSGGS